MIDEVHMLTNTAFNAMLKTLEEPPEYLKFVLATTDPQKVPVTVLSRCLQFNLRPMAPETVLDTPDPRAGQRKRARRTQALRLLSRAARAPCAMRSRSPTRPLPLAAASCRSGCAPDAGRGGSLLRVPPHRRAGPGRWQNRGGNGDALRMKRPVGRIDAGRNERRVAAHGRVPGRAAGWPRRWMRSDPEAVETARLAAQMPADETQLLYSLCLHGRAELGLAPDEYAALTMVLLLCWPSKPLQIRLKKTLTRPETAPSGSGGCSAACGGSLPVAPLPAPSSAGSSAAAAPVASVAPAVAQPRTAWSQHLYGRCSTCPGGRVCAFEEDSSNEPLHGRRGRWIGAHHCRLCVWLKR